MKFCKLPDRLLQNKQRNMPKQSLRNTASYKTDCSKATSTVIWVHYHLKMVIRRMEKT